MKQITVEQALKLIEGRDEIHCMMSNPISQPHLLTVGWHKEYPSAVKAIQTADKLFLLSGREAFLSHRLYCVKPKGKYPEEQVYMEV